MSDFFLIFTILSVPIFILLFVRQIKRKKVAYSFTFLQRFKSQSLKQILLKVIHLFYDIIFDLLIALMLALIFSNIVISFGESNKVAFVIDGSYSMMKTDINGSTPFEKAILYYYSHRSIYKSHDLYGATFDIKKAKSKIVSLKRMKNIINPKIFEDQYLKNYNIFEFDVNALSDLKLKKYKKVIFLTDFFPYNISRNKIANYEIIELGYVQKDFFYPISIIYEPVSENIYCNFIKSKGSFLPKVEVYDKNKSFLNAIDKVKLDFNNENSIILETKEKSLFKVTLFNQSYYIDLSKVSSIVNASGKYSTLLKNVIFQFKDYENDLIKLKERGFILNKNLLPIIAIYDKDIEDNFIKNFLKNKNSQKLIYQVDFNKEDIDIIFDPDFTTGMLIGTNENNLKENIEKIKNKNLKIINSPLFNNKIDKTNVYPVNISEKFLMQPQSIVYFYMLTDLFEKKVLFKSQNLIINLNEDESKIFDFETISSNIERKNKEKKIKYKTLNNANIVEQNNTSILYKTKDSLIYKNIDIKEIYQYKKLEDFEIQSQNNIQIIYLIIIALLFLSKFVVFLILKNN